MPQHRQRHASRRARSAEKKAVRCATRERKKVAERKRSTRGRLIMAARRGWAFDVGSVCAIGGVLNVALQRSDGEGKTRLVAAAGSSCQVVSDDGVRRHRRVNRAKVVIWLILPVVICLSQRLSHASVSTSSSTVKLRMAH